MFEVAIDEQAAADTVGSALDAARSAISALQAIELDRLPLDDRVEAIDAVHRLSDQMAALHTSVVEQMDRSGVWQAERAVSPAAWLRCKIHRPASEASVVVRRARALRTAPKLASSFAEGRVSGARVDAVLRVRNERTAEFFDRDEDLLVAHAESLRFDELVQVLRRWSQLADVDGPDPDAEQFEARRLFHSQTLQGSWATEAHWDKVGGAEIDTALDAECERLFLEDWSEAEHRLGREPLPTELWRSPAQRRADAMLELIRRGHASSSAAPRPLVNIVVGLDTLTGPVAELIDGTVVSPGTVARHLFEAHVRSLVFDGPDRVVSMTSKQRLFSGPLREAIEIRDRECQHPLCDTPARRCQVDHVVPYPEGPTAEPNGQLLCGHHNRLKDRRPGVRQRRNSAGREPPDR